MKKNVWIFNHYAGPPSLTGALRHYMFSKYLQRAGYNVKVFAASAVHNTDRNLIPPNGPRWIEDDSEGVPFVFLKTRSYEGNGVGRVLNMIDYYRGLFKMIKTFDKPDIILASSVHPLTCVAGIKIAKRLGVPCICEIRDLWPQSIVDFGHFSQKNPLIKGLYILERRIYKNADAIIFTMKGGVDYLREKKLDSVVDLNKVYYINNGVDLALFDAQVEETDRVETNEKVKPFRFVYTGSIRQANNLDMLVKSAEILQGKNNNIYFDIYGNGEARPQLETYVEEHHIKNVTLHGAIPKSKIPGVLADADACILHYSDAGIWKYGSSNNKLFEYMASGKPILSTVHISYGPVDEYDTGVTADKWSVEGIAEAMQAVAQAPLEVRCKWGRNARKVAELYNYPILASKLVDIIEGLT